MRLYLAVSLAFLGAATTTYLSCGSKDAASNKTESAAPATSPEPVPAVGTLSISADTVNQIIGVVDPVTAYPASDTSTGAVATAQFNKLAIQTQLTDAPVHGVLFGSQHQDIHSRFFANNKAGSVPYCNAVNNGMKFFFEASTPDFNLCVIRLAAKTKNFPIVATQAQIWDFKISTDQGQMTYRMKFAIDADADGKLKSFENFTCEGQGAGPLKQSGYSKEVLGNDSVTVHTRSQGDHGQGPYSLLTEMNSALDATGHMIGIKNIKYAEKGDGRKVASNVKQSSENIETIAYEQSEGGTTQSVNFIELVDTNSAGGVYQPTKLGFGDGAALVRTTNNGVSTETSGWSGDTLLANTQEPRIAKVTGREAEFLDPATDTTDLSFAATETYDCSGTADQTMTATMQDVNDCMGFQIDQEGGSMCNANSGQ